MSAYEVLPSHPQDSAAWHEARRQGIGASDVAAVLGLSPWQTPLDIYRAKKGVPNEIDPDLAYFGHALEPVIAEWIEDRHIDETGPLLDGLSARSEEWPWLTAAPDRTAWAPAKMGVPLVRLPVELKTSSAFSKAAWADGVPLYYQAQVQAQCAVLGAPYGWLAVLHGGNSPELHRIERDDTFINEQLVPQTREFWEQHVLTDTPPDPSTSAEAAELWPGDGAVPAVEADEDLLALFSDLTRSKAAKDQSAADADRYALMIQQRLGNATELRHGKQILATWKPHAGARRLDTTALRKDHPDLADAYTKQGADTRVFRPKTPKEAA